jgi:PilZ domain
VASGGSAKKTFQPGELAPVSGIYLVTHLTNHRQPHEAVIIRGEDLPICRVCKAAIVFEIVTQISHVTHDWDFAGPTELMIKSKAPGSLGIRILPRFKVEVPITVEVSHPQRPVMIHGHTHDLGEGGVGATILGKLPPQRRAVALKISLNGTKEPLVLRAHIRYRKGLRHGFKFTRMRAAEREAIRAASGGIVG